MTNTIILADLHNLFVEKYKWLIEEKNLILTWSIKNEHVTSVKNTIWNCSAAAAYLLPQPMDPEKLLRFYTVFQIEFNSTP